MAMICDNCGKKSMYGHRVSHAKNRTNYKFRPNLQKKTIVESGKKMQLRLCTSCIKLMKKIDRDKKALLESQATATA